MIEQSLQNAHILIVDDEAANVDILEGLMAFQGFSGVKSTTDPTMVVELCESFKPDIILLDLMMSPLSGFEVLDLIRQFRALETYLPVLVLTADINSETRQRALSGGANDFVTKPFDLIEVGQRIRNLLQTRYLYKQAENQNQILEHKVKIRTSELEQLNAELIIARDDAQANDNLKSAFIRSISHEIRTPLNGILGISSLLVDPDLASSEKLVYVPYLKVSIDRMINTITNYLDISMIVTGNVILSIRKFNLDKELREIEQKFREQISSKDIVLNLELPENHKLHDLKTDRDVFKKIIGHLLDNALKFTNSGEIIFGYSFESDLLRFYVKDTGVGINDKVKSRIFDNFVQESIQASRDYEGSGLGLSIARGFLKLLGGEISFESEKGKGSMFFFTLPAK